MVLNALGDVELVAAMSVDSPYGRLGMMRNLCIHDMCRPSHREDVTDSGESADVEVTSVEVDVVLHHVGVETSKKRG